MRSPKFADEEVELAVVVDRHRVGVDEAGVAVETVHDYRDVLFGGHAPEPDDHLLGDAKAKMKETGALLAGGGLANQAASAAGGNAPVPISRQVASMSSLIPVGPQMKT